MQWSKSENSPSQVPPTILGGRLLQFPHGLLLLETASGRCALGRLKRAVDAIFTLTLRLLCVLSTDRANRGGCVSVDPRLTDLHAPELLPAKGHVVDDSGPIVEGRLLEGMGFAVTL